MCGRFTVAWDEGAIVRRFCIDEVRDHIEARYNVAPQTQVPVVVQQNGRRILGNVRWGLVPHSARSVTDGPHPINARAETVATRAMFRDLLQKRRCLVIADSFFEWKAAEKGKRPFRIELKSHEPFAMAGLWDGWRDPKAGPDAPWLRTCTIITTPPNELVETLHDRMPAILESRDENTWLDPTIVEADKLLPLLRPYPSNEMGMYEVSKAVNSVKNQGPECIEAV